MLLLRLYRAAVIKQLLLLKLLSPI